jgi:glutathione S-transferase
MSALRIFSYLPNPRVWKATIPARLCGVEVEVRGTDPSELADWLWDFDAHPMTAADRSALAHCARRGTVGITTTIYKTDAFLAAHPFGNVPAAFGPDGEVGIFESNSIMRAVARLGAARCQLYGDDAYAASRIDGFLDVTLLFARDVQIYVLSLRGKSCDAAIHASMARGLASYLTGIERALGTSEFIAGNSLSLADIACFAELALLHNEHLHAAHLDALGVAPLLGRNIEKDYPRSIAHFARLRRHEAFAPDAEDYLSGFSRAAKTP